MLRFNGVPSRLVIIRNVSYIIEQQKLLTRSVYDRKLTDTLSHELLTPLNCVINLSEHLRSDLKSELKALADEVAAAGDNRAPSDPMAQMPRESIERLEDKRMRKGKQADYCELVWSSGKMLEFIIRSIISRQQYQDRNVIVKRSTKSAKEIEQSLQKVIAPFTYQMTRQKIKFKFINDIIAARGADSLYVANWDLLNQAVFYPIANAIKFNKMGGTVNFTLSMKEIDARSAYLQCAIEDSGVGIAPCKMKSLFKAFDLSKNDEGGRNSLFASTQGSGLGLSTTKSLILVQGGKVMVESEVGLYTRLTMIIKVQI